MASSNPSSFSLASNPTSSNDIGLLDTYLSLVILLCQYTCTVIHTLPMQSGQTSRALINGHVKSAIIPKTRSRLINLKYQFAAQQLHPFQFQLHVIDGLRNQLNKYLKKITIELQVGLQLMPALVSTKGNFPHYLSIICSLFLTPLRPLNKRNLLAHTLTIS